MRFGCSCCLLPKCTMRKANGRQEGSLGASLPQRSRQRATGEGPPANSIQNRTLQCNPDCPRAAAHAHSVSLLPHLHRQTGANSWKETAANLTDQGLMAHTIALLSNLLKTPIRAESRDINLFGISMYKPFYLIS